MPGATASDGPQEVRNSPDVNDSEEVRHKVGEGTKSMPARPPRPLFPRFEKPLYSICATGTHVPSSRIDSFPAAMIATFSTMSRSWVGAVPPSKNRTIPSTRRV